MSKVEVKQTVKQLNPYGEKLMKVWYDDNMPPKNYIWYKDDSYMYWNGEEWVEFDLGVVEPDAHDHNKHHHHHCCCEEEKKFEKFKKDMLAAVLRLVKSQSSGDLTELTEQVAALQADVASLKAINHDLFIRNNELEMFLQDLGYLKESDIEGLDILANLDSRLNDIDDRISNNSSNVRGLNTRVTALENAGFITSASLNEYATRNYVDNAVDAIHVPTNVSELANDSGYVSGVEVTYHDEDPNDMRTLSNGDVINIVEDVEFDREQPGTYKLYVSMYPYQINIETPEPADPYDDSAIQESISGLDDRISTLEENSSSVDGSLSSLDERVSAIEGNYIELEKEEVISAAFNDLNDRMLDVENADFASKSYVNQAVQEAGSFDADNYYTKEEIDEMGYLTEHQDISGKANVSDLAAVATSGDYNDLRNTPELFSGNYNDLTNKPTIPTSLDDLSNDLEDPFLTESMANERYEPIFTDLTNEEDPVTEAKSHGEDNKVYITAIEPEPEEEEGGV